MSRAPSKFRQSDVKRAIRAAAAGGMSIARVEIDLKGRIILIGADEHNPERALEDNPIRKMPLPDVPVRRRRVR